MSNPAYIKSVPGKWAGEGVRVVSDEDLSSLGENTKIKVEAILESMDWPRLVVFNYGGSDRVVAPFVVGVSSEGVALLRGFQLAGVSKSGKGAGWRVFKVAEMENLDTYQDYFTAADFDFDRGYPWIYKVFKML